MKHPFLLTHLTILQQEGYESLRFLSWWFRHPFTYKVSTKKPLVFTSKIKTIVNLANLFLALFIATSLVLHSLILVFSTIVIYIFFPFNFLFLSLFVLYPYEKINRVKTLNRVRNTITARKDLTTIGITGSYGKTSVKDFLYTILSSWQDTVKTPESYNTLFGIAKVVDLELLSKTKIFVCEMGAYVRGEIAELCRMVPPRYAVLTAIGSQHLERFKSLANTTLAKFELIDATDPSRCLVNLDNQYIAENIKKSKYKHVLTYSLLNSHADYFVSSYTITPSGLSFSINHKNKTHKYSSKLFGTSNLYNLTAAIAMSHILEVPKKIIQDSVSGIVSSPHRLELRKINQATLIDNAFSSNEEGFTAVLNDLRQIKGRKVLITPGIVELGAKTAEVHHKLGGLSFNIFDKFILVGKSDRTLNFEKGILSSASLREGTPTRQSTKTSSEISYIDNTTNLWPIIEDLSKEYDWILLENDLPDNF